MKRILMLVAVLSVFVLSIGTAQARLSTNDAVPGQDIVIPVICEGTLDGANNPVFGNLNTLIAIAEKDGGPHFSSPNSAYVAIAGGTLYDYKSQFVVDFTRKWTPLDVVTDNCQGLVLAAPSADRARMLVTMPKQGGGTITVFAGYVIYQQIANPNIVVPDDFLSQTPNRFVPWVYLVDLTKGFASGFNGISSEDGVGPQLGEDVDGRPVSAAHIFPRMFMLNDNADTWNWWILLAGRNKLGLVNSTLYSTNRVLDGVVCDEQEVCDSVRIPIPYELNIIDVLSIVPNAVKVSTGFPAAALAGFGSLSILETGSVLLPAPGPISITGTSNYDTNAGALFPLVDSANYYSLYGWSYQRQASNAGPGLSWDVMHEIHRTYCSASENGVAQGDLNAEPCSAPAP